ncbi:MAG: adenylate cyclase [Pseudoalteromonas tetraodonis]|jgi:adenylate cyclase
MSDIFQFIGERIENEGEQGLDEAVWERFGCERTVLVADMAGFTITTRKHGIVHYLQLIERMRVTASSLLNSLGGQLVRFEADNLFAVFQNPVAALEFANAFVQLCEEDNQSRPRESQIHLSIGIDHGEILLHEDDFFGAAVNMASKLGEDLAQPREILTTQRVVEMTAGSGIELEKVGAHDFSGKAEATFRMVRL